MTGLWAKRRRRASGISFPICRNIHLNSKEAQVIVRLVRPPQRRKARAEIFAELEPWIGGKWIELRRQLLGANWDRQECASRHAKTENPNSCKEGTWRKPKPCHWICHDVCKADGIIDRLYYCSRESTMPSSQAGRPAFRNDTFRSGLPAVSAKTLCGWSHPRQGGRFRVPFTALAA